MPRRAEAGAIRYITNEPKIDKTEGYVKGGYGVTAHGDPNTDVQAVLNLPLIEGHMAIQLRPSTSPAGCRRVRG
jgi:iron complex outermembrane recepter protein